MVECTHFRSHLKYRTFANQPFFWPFEIQTSPDFRSPLYKKTNIPCKIKTFLTITCRTRPVFEWPKAVQLSNDTKFEWHVNTRTVCTIFFNYLPFFGISPCVRTFYQINIPKRDSNLGLQQPLYLNLNDGLIH